jgi:hypothetical protein
VMRFNFGSIDKPYTFGITNGKDSLNYRHSELPRVQVNVTNGKQLVSLYMIAFMNPEVTFDEEHKRAFDNQVVVEVPEVYELTNVLLALTPHCRRDSNLVDMNKAYFKEVQLQFAQWESSPLVAALNKALEADPDMYLSFRNSGFAYSFQFDELVENTNYKNFNGKLGVKDFKVQIEDFAKRSGFRKFYSKHKAYYKTLTDAQNQWVNLASMKTWLEARYPNRINAYRIILSPLVNGWHNVNNFSDNNFNEAVMFIYAFDPSAPRKETAAVTRYQLCRIIFTELDHAYVNPITDAHTAALNAAMPDLKPWKAESNTDYNSAYETFNEYMTFALFALYMNDHMSAADFNTTYPLLQKMMTERRGFSKFSQFSDALLVLHRTGEKDPNTLCTQMIGWVKTAK